MVRRLREKAALEGVSVEEEHRRVLRQALLGSAEAPGDLKSHLLAIPEAAENEPEDLFTRQRSLPRDVNL